MRLLITRPRHDPPTHYLFYWSETLVKEAQNEGLDVIDLKKEKANKDNFQSYLKKRPINIVILNGHGNANSVGGQDNEVIISTNDGADLLKGKRVFIRACEAGLLLGQEIIKKGAMGFIGYIQPFIFLTDKNSFHKPLEDKLARPFLECSNQVALSLIKGNSAEDAHKDSLRKYNENIEKLSTSETENSFLLPYLLWNMSSQVCY